MSKSLTFFLFWATALVFAPVDAQAECRDDHVDLRGAWGQAGFHVELAQTNRARARGLMNRPFLPLGQGMLFVYPFAHEPAFWMKNTLIPLDIIFLTSEGRVTHVHENAQPGDLTPISGGDNVRFVLEINGGLARRIGISPGTEMRAPSVKQTIAVWPCKDLGPTTTSR